MNKIKSAIIDNWDSVYDEWNHVQDIKSYNDWITDTYGIGVCPFRGVYEIKDQSKFILFMLKYPESIYKINYNE